MPVLMRENTMIGNLAIKPGERESVSVVGDGEKTVQDLLYELAQNIDANKINDGSYIAIHSIIQGIINVTEKYHIVSIYTLASDPSSIGFEIHAISYNYTYMSTTGHEVSISELVISTDNNNNQNQYRKTSTNYTSGQTPTMTFSDDSTDIVPAGSEIIFYY